MIAVNAAATQALVDHKAGQVIRHGDPTGKLTANSPETIHEVAIPPVGRKALQAAVRGTNRSSTGIPSRAHVVAGAVAARAAALNP